MELRYTATDILEQIRFIVLQLSSDSYSKPLDILDGISIGMHVRHVLECFGVILEEGPYGHLNYENRKRIKSLETQPEAACIAIDDMQQEILVLLRKNVVLEAKFNRDMLSCNSSIDRELVYAVEHAIHHIAIIKITLKAAFSEISIPEHFGVAHSTARYRQEISTNN